MSFKFNKIGNFAIPLWGSGTGDFSVNGAFKYPSGGDFQILLAGSGTGHLVYADSGGTLKTKHGGTATINGLFPGINYWYEESRTVNTITVKVYTFPAMVLVGTDAISFGGTNVPYDSFGATSAGTFPFDGEMSGVWTFTDDAAGVRTYDFDQSVGTEALPDTTSAQDGVKANGNNGDYTGTGTNSISITSHADGDFLKRDSISNAKVVTLSGDISGTQPTLVEASVDYGDWLTIDAAPTATTWSGDVTIKAKQNVRVRGVGADTMTAPLTLMSGLTIAAIGDSNQYGYGINNQPIEVGAFSHQPLMYNGTSIVDAADPTAIGANGSTLPRMVSRYARGGTPVCIYNIGNAGTKASDWQKGNANYDKLTAFAALVGGIESVTVQLGTNDAAAGVSQASFATDMNAIVNDIFADFGANTLITKFPSDSVGTPTDRANIFTAIDDVVDNNPNAYAGGDLSVIDISAGAAVGNDGIHLKQDEDLTAAGDIIYTANIAAISSNINITLTGIPDGAAKTVFIDVTDIDSPTLHQTKTLTYTSSVAQASVESPIGSKIVSIELGAIPKATGGADYGVTT